MIHLKILGAGKVTRGTEDPQIIGATLHKLVATANWRPGFVHHWTIVISTLTLITFTYCDSRKKAFHRRIKGLSNITLGYKWLLLL